ncbi:MAG: c-type cytochrome [Planctomycetota bacterium]
MELAHRMATALLGASLALALGCEADGDRPGFIVLPDMVESTALDTFAVDTSSPSGGALRLPPPGTVPWEVPWDGYGPGPEEAARAGLELTSPPLATAGDRERGQRLYETFCQVCHGPGGEGDGPVIGAFPNPPSLLAEHARQMADGQIYHVIRHGQGIMASYAGQVRPLDRWRIVLYVRRLQGAPEEPASEESK